MQTQRRLAASRGTTERPAGGASSGRDYGAYRRTLSKLARRPSQPSEAAEPPSPGAAELPVLFETDERRGVPPERRLIVSAGGQRPRTSPLYLSKDDTSRPISPALSLRPTDGRARQLCRILSARANASRTPNETKNSPIRTTQQTAPNAPPRPKRPRCQLCRKRLGLASVHTCHCAGVFCAQHRYPEAHQCGHDFKTEGRRILERANPLILAPKLPKI
ncbi:zinc finger A20 and AN1 domain-containing stress-associated protein 6-like [Amphibalanus amphitrite]|uniref:zinc finger A20 and AN1 domain-containing stress-associated protein 6-like n=1 Tax=Amphibalanus amphitrite TaxID=1232801 RepID=UPI001C904FFE|nr:zinc finger A20 and AN1 domain-containing stress-associated protein 6-like [Amphibalanus amphitrite]